MQHIKTNSLEKVASECDISNDNCFAQGLHFLSNINTHTHIHPFNCPFSGTTRVGWYQKGKTNLDFTEARDSE